MCPTCKRKAVEHQHSLTKVLANAIWDFAKQTKGKSTRLKSLGWNRTRWQNFSKLKYWDLIAQDNPKSGEWRITHKGVLFVTGGLAIPKSVWTWADQVVEYGGEKLFLRDVWGQMPDYQDRVDFSDVERPHFNSIQQSLF